MALALGLTQAEIWRTTPRDFRILQGARSELVRREVEVTDKMLARQTAMLGNIILGTEENPMPFSDIAPFRAIAEDLGKESKEEPDLAEMDRNMSMWAAATAERFKNG
jgi:hypothetical protein